MRRSSDTSRKPGEDKLMRRDRTRRWIKLATGLTALFVVGLLVSSALAVTGTNGSSTSTDATTTTVADTTTTAATTTDATTSTDAGTTTTVSGTTTSADAPPPPPTAPLAAPTLLTDKTTYVPGDTVTVTGANWLPGESVHVHAADGGG